MPTPFLSCEYGWSYHGPRSVLKNPSIGDSALSRQARARSQSEQSAGRTGSAAGDLLLPALVVKEAALDGNIAVMADFCRRHGVSHCPHVKTPMAPQVAQRQLDAGAWGLSAANVSQARVLRAFGAERILIANEVLDPVAINWLAAAMENNADLELWCLVDRRQGSKL